MLGSFHISNYWGFNTKALQEHSRALGRLITEPHHLLLTQLRNVKVQIPICVSKIINFESPKKCAYKGEKVTNIIWKSLQRLCQSPKQYKFSAVKALHTIYRVNGLW